MKHLVSIPGTPYAYHVAEVETADVHDRVLRALWLGLKISKVCELTKTTRPLVDRARNKARETLGNAGLAVPSWLDVKQQTPKRLRGGYRDDDE